MLYCKLNGEAKISLSVSSLFSGSFAAASGQDFDSARANPIQVDAVRDVQAGQTVFVAQGKWYGAEALPDGAWIGGLVSCAAVLFYEFCDGNWRLYAAGHAGGGYIEGNEIENINPASPLYVIYATPTLDEDTKDYKESIQKLIDKYGTERVCAIDGFEKDVIATPDGYLIFY